VFWKRVSRQVRRQKVMDELTDLDPTERRIRLNRAVADGDIRGDEMDVLLRTVGRLDELKVMAIPSRFNRWPAEELIGASVTEMHLAVPAARARARSRVAIDVAPEPQIRSSRPGLRVAAARKVVARRPVTVGAKAEDDRPNISWLRPA
jgi:hypothetical protein